MEPVGVVVTRFDEFWRTSILNKEIIKVRGKKIICNFVIGIFKTVFIETPEHLYPTLKRFVSTRSVSISDSIFNLKLIGNFQQLFDFALTADDMDRISSLNQDLVIADWWGIVSS